MVEYICTLTKVLNLPQKTYNRLITKMFSHILILCFDGEKRERERWELEGNGYRTTKRRELANKRLYGSEDKLDYRKKVEALLGGVGWD